MSTNLRIKIAIIADNLTYESLAKETNVKRVTPKNYKLILKFWKPDFLFVESAWNGYKNEWKYKIASYPDSPKRNNHTLQKVVKYAKNLGIPTIFWNKEDGVHFDRFIESAKLFDHIFTVDENCISKYKSVVGKEVTVNTLMFAVQSKFHNFSDFNFKYDRACFVGSYSQHVHKKRQVWQDMIFRAAYESSVELLAYDRNSDRKSKVYRYPQNKNILVKKAVSYEGTAQIYKDNLISLNVNTIEDSKTMFSRRLIEILACGGIAVTNSTPAVEHYFRDYCYVVTNEAEAETLFRRLKDGPSETDLRRAEAGAAYVAKEHTWTHRLEEIANVIGLK